jgi:hypothetical protein
VVGLDVATGNVSWNQSIGPLSNEKSFPTVDNNGKEIKCLISLQSRIPDHIYPNWFY